MNEILFNTKEIRFATAMSELLFQMRNESDAYVDGVTKERSDAIADDPVHIANIKNRIFQAVFNQAINDSDYFETDEAGEYIYTPMEVYDYCYEYDTYIEEVVEKERQSKLKTKYKIWVEVERIDIDEDGEEEYSDCDCPIGIAYVNTFEEAEQLQRDIEKQFGNI